MPLNRDNFIAQANMSPTSPGKKVRFAEEVEGRGMVAEHGGVCRGPVRINERLRDAIPRL